MKQKNSCDLKTCLLCKLCIKEWLPAIEGHRRIIHLQKGKQLFREGDPVTGVYFIYTGVVKVHMQWGQDKELIVRFAKKGDIVGHRGLGTDTIYPISVTALEPVVVCYIALDFFKTSLKINHDFIYELMMFYARELQESERNMRNLAHMPVKSRLADALLKLQSKFGKDKNGFIGITLSRQDLASYTGTTYETVFRMLSDLAAESIIKTDGKKIGILKEKILLGLITSNPGNNG